MGSRMVCAAATAVPMTVNLLRALKSMSCDTQIGIAGERNLVGARFSSPGRMLSGCESKSIGDARVGPGEKPGWKLHGGKRPVGETNPPRLQVPTNANDVTATVDKGHINRKVHEEGMDSVARCQNQGGIVCKRVTAKEALPAAP